MIKPYNYVKIHQVPKCDAHSLVGILLVGKDNILIESCWLKPNLDCNYTFPIDLAPNWIQFGFLLNPSLTRSRKDFLYLRIVKLFIFYFRIEQRLLHNMNKVSTFVFELHLSIKINWFMKIYISYFVIYRFFIKKLCTSRNYFHQETMYRFFH